MGSGKGGWYIGDDLATVTTSTGLTCGSVPLSPNKENVEQPVLINTIGIISNFFIKLIWISYYC